MQFLYKSILRFFCKTLNLDLFKRAYTPTSTQKIILFSYTSSNFFSEIPLMV